MSTNTEIITDALSLIGILAEGETPSAEQAAHGLRKLNQMMAAWETDGIVLGFFEQTDTTATCPIPDWAEKGVYGGLAIDVAGDYGVTPPPLALKTADDGYTHLLRRVMVLNMPVMDTSHLGSVIYNYNIETDV